MEVAAGRYDASGFAEGPITQLADAGAHQIEGQAVDLAAREPVFRPIAGRQPARPPSVTRPDFWVRRLLKLGTDRPPVNEFAALRELIGPAPPGVTKVDWAEV